jgi:DNA repair exonuclease SbcCD ATPase subunit
MKKIFILPTFISLAMICSCQKQDSVAEQELAQRKTELDARENRLDERMNELGEKVEALDGRVKMLAEKQKIANAGTSLNGVQRETSDPAQEQAERERIQQLSAEMRARMADPMQRSSANAEKNRRTQERLAQRQRALDGSKTQKQRKSNMFSGAVFPAPAAAPSTIETTAATPSTATEAASSTPSPAP